MEKKRRKTAGKKMSEQVAIYSRHVLPEGHPSVDGKVLRAAIYTRCTSAYKGRKPVGLDKQVTACWKMARELGYPISVDYVYEDIGISGDSSDRSALRSLLAAAHNGAFDALFVNDLRRLASDVKLAVELVESLQAAGVSVYSVADELPADLESSPLLDSLKRDLKRSRSKGK